MAFGIGALAMGGAFGQSEGFKGRQHQRDIISRAVSELGNDRLGESYRFFQGLNQPLIGQYNALIGASSLGSQSASRSAIAGLNRAGLGNTGLGAALSAAISRGSAFQGNQLRARLMADLNQQAINNALAVQGQRASVFQSLLGAPIPSGTNAGTAFLSSAAQSAATAAAAGA